MKPLPPFSDLDAAGFADLLEVRLKVFHGPGEAERLTAMDLFDHTLMRWTPANEWLGAFYAGLSPPSQLQFRHAIARAITRARPDSFPLDALLDLIQLAGDVGAFEALPAMVDLLADGGPWASVRPGPLPSVLAVMKRFGCTEDDAAFAQVERLLALPTSVLGDRLAFDALEVLLCARPTRWAEAWTLVAPHLQCALSPSGGDPDQATAAWFDRRMTDLVQRCFAPLSPRTLADGLRALDQTMGPNVVAALDDGMALCVLFVKLVCDADSPFEIHGGDSVGDSTRRLVWRGCAHDARVDWPALTPAWDHLWRKLSSAKVYLDLYNLGTKLALSRIEDLDAQKYFSALFLQSDHSYFTVVKYGGVSLNRLTGLLDR